LKRADKYKSTAFTDTCTKKEIAWNRRPDRGPPDGQKSIFSHAVEDRQNPNALGKDRSAQRTIRGKETVVPLVFTSRVISDKSRTMLHSEVKCSPNMAIPRKNKRPKRGGRFGSQFRTSRLLLSKPGGFPRSACSLDF
jgi:hypothetical protein